MLALSVAMLFVSASGCADTQPSDDRAVSMTSHNLEVGRGVRPPLDAVLRQRERERVPRPAPAPQDCGGRREMALFERRAEENRAAWATLPRDERERRRSAVKTKSWAAYRPLAGASNAMAQLLRGILATLAATTVIVTAEGNALADPSIATADGRVDLTNVGVIHSYVHEKVPAGTTVTIETVNIAVSPATVDYLDTIVHVFDRDTRQHVATNDDCGSAYSSCLTLPADSNVRSYVIYVHAYSHYTHGMAELRISHNGTAQVETQPFSFGGIRVWTGVSLPTDSLLFTTGYSSAPLGTRLIALNSSSTPQALDDNDGAMGFSNLHLPATLPSGGSFVVGAHGGLMSGGPPDTAGASLHWKSNMSYMMPFQKKVEDTALQILREAAQAPDGRWFTAFAQAFGGRINYNQALAIKNDILQGVRYPVALQLVAPSVLVGSQGQALGAYGVNKIFLSTALTDEYTAGNIFIEEIGHYFDKTIGGTGDAPGDEGHMFWSYIVGESLTAAELANLKALDDTGTICTSVNQCFAVSSLGCRRGSANSAAHCMAASRRGAVGCGGKPPPLVVLFKRPPTRLGTAGGPDRLDCAGRA